jgi:hypothetical protein
MPLHCGVVPQHLRPCRSVLQGYKLTDRQDGSRTWAFTSGVSLAPGQYLLVFASSKDRSNPSAPLHTSFALSGDDGYVGLLAADGSEVSGVRFPVCARGLGCRPLLQLALPAVESLCVDASGGTPMLLSSLLSVVLARRLPTDVSFGTVGGQVAAAAESSPRYAVLATPTPGKPNSGPRPGGPLVIG